MSKILYLTDPQDPLVALVRESAPSSMTIDVRDASSAPKLDYLPDAILAGDAAFGFKPGDFPSSPFVQLTRGRHPDIDVAALNDSGVTVASASPVLARYVARHVAGLLAVAIDPAGQRGLVQRHNVASLLDSPDFWAPVSELRVGIVGFGITGRATADLFAAQGASVVYCDIRTPPRGTGGAAGARRSSLDLLLSRSDVVSVHAPFGPTANPLIGARELGLMPEGAVLINVADGRVVAEQDLIGALESGQIAVAGIDVTANGVPSAGHPLVSAPNVVATPYVAARCEDADAEVAKYVVKNIARVLVGDDPGGVIEPVDYPKVGDPAFWSSRMAPQV